MFAEFLRAWSIVPAISAAIWHSGFVVGMYGWDMGRKVFILHYISEIQERKRSNYSL